MTNPDAPIPYTLAHVWCCECEDCLNPVPYRLAGAGKVHSTGGQPGSVVMEIEAAKARVRDRKRRAKLKAGRAG